jgi:exopolyphosphatase/guanosine-5'-triphosphate,3'-diphosphate pyrophosphatase
MAYQKLLLSTSAENMAVSNVTMRDGLLMDLAMAVSGKTDKSVISQLTNSAKALAAQYHVDMDHALHVSYLAGRLYDELAMKQWFSIDRKPLLQAAAMLHEVGMFISSRAHHKHSYYVISNSELFGVEPKEQEIVAHIARYHRRSRPKTAHIEYMRLPREQRMIINKLAAILRIADALDVNRTQDVKDFSCEFEDDRLTIAVSESNDLILEKKAINMKSNLFEEIYGFKIKLEKALV